MTLEEFLLNFFEPDVLQSLKDASDDNSILASDLVVKIGPDQPDSGKEDKRPVLSVDTNEDEVEVILLVGSS